MTADRIDVDGLGNDARVFSWLVQFPTPIDNDNAAFALEALFDGTITRLITLIDAGNCDALFTINGTPVQFDPDTGSNAVNSNESIDVDNTTEMGYDADAANTFTAGQKVQVVLSNCSSAADNFVCELHVRRDRA